jgi:two-component system, NtrC family, sensor kinase
VDGKAEILVIDDEDKLGKLTARTLAPDYDALAVTSAQAALDLIAEGRRFDLILCDLVMPQMDGVVFAERLKVIAPELLKRVVFMTGGAFTARTIAFTEGESIRLIEKPFPSAPEFRALVGKHLRRAPA